MTENGSAWWIERDCGVETKIRALEMRLSVNRVWVELDIITQRLEEMVLDYWDLVYENLKFKLWFWAWSRSSAGYCKYTYVSVTVSRILNKCLYSSSNLCNNSVALRLRDILDPLFLDTDRMCRLPPSAWRNWGLCEDFGTRLCVSELQRIWRSEG